MYNEKKKFFSAGHAAVTIAILSLIVLLNCAMFGSKASLAMSSGIRYKTGEANRISLECVLAWDSGNVPAILDVLRESDTRITFVVTGETAKQNPVLIRQMVSDGHSILTMGMHFSDAEILTEDELFESIEDSLFLLRQAAAEATGFYCASADTGKALRASGRAGLACYRCTRDLLCARGESSDIISRAKESAKGGSIIAATPTAAFCEALPDLLVTYRKMGFDVGGVEAN